MWKQISKRQRLLKTKLRSQRTPSVETLRIWRSQLYSRWFRHHWQRHPLEALVDPVVLILQWGLMPQITERLSTQGPTLSHLCHFCWLFSILLHLRTNCFYFFWVRYFHTYLLWLLFFVYILGFCFVNCVLTLFCGCLSLWLRFFECKWFWPFLKNISTSCCVWWWLFLCKFEYRS